MASTFSSRRALFALGLVAGVLLCSAAAPAALQMSTGIRYVVDNAPPTECGTKAKTALDAYLQNASENPEGSGDWFATGPIGGTGPATAAATVRCYPVGQGYVVTFTCSVQLPENPYAADALCLDVAHNFSGKPVTPLATPTPLPTGCTTTNLVGTWTGTNDGNDVTLKLDASGGLTDNEDVSGNWGLYGNTVTLTYYGTHTLKLSPDGKHMSGDGYNFTRKC
ncbi:MAG TPA: hypothetical protein VNG31_00640 [Candidatus Baltobacteraceae bacterium]|nr:hypothetical protein [Candidatus Baltobacteraceae bacterium]